MIDKTIEIVEGKTKILSYLNKKTKKGPGKRQGLPFYNPSMEMNRDISIIVLQNLCNISKKKIFVVDGLGATGIRGIRFAKEVDGNFKLIINDINKDSCDLIRENIKRNNIEDVDVLNKNFNVILSGKKFDYIDIDPFGTPVYFIDSAMKSIRKNGVIGISATDTAALCGVYPKVCRRRYGGIPIHGRIMKEVGIRILFGHIARVAARYDKGILPLLSYSTDHYFRIYIKVIKGVVGADNCLDKIDVISSDDIFNMGSKKNIGPLWMDNINDKDFIVNIRSIMSNKTLGSKNILWNFLDILEEEAEAPMFFYTTDDLSSKNNVSTPKFDLLREEFLKNGYSFFKTHFNSCGFKTNAESDVVEKIFKQLV